jgi:hypothetical protein
MTLIAYLFLQHLRLRAAKWEKNKTRQTTTATDAASHPAKAARSSGARYAPAMSDLPGPLHSWFNDGSAKVVLL